MSLLIFIILWLLFSMALHYFIQFACERFDKYLDKKYSDQRKFEVGETVWYIGEKYVIDEWKWWSYSLTTTLYIYRDDHYCYRDIIQVDSKQVKKVQRAYFMLEDRV